MPYNKYKIVRLIIIPLSLFLLIFLYLQLKVVLNKDAFTPINSDAIVILGHVIDDYYMPSYLLEERLKTGLYLYNNNYADIIIVSGGIGPTDDFPVALGMKKWLINNGVPYESILMECESNNTYENFKYTKYLADYNNISSIIVVTNDFHMFRSIYIANMHFENVSGSAAYTQFNFRKLLAYLKEPLSIIKYTVVNKVNTLMTYFV